MASKLFPKWFLALVACALFGVAVWELRELRVESIAGFFLSEAFFISVGGTAVLVAIIFLVVSLIANRVIKKQTLKYRALEARCNWQLGGNSSRRWAYIQGGMTFWPEGGGLAILEFNPLKVVVHYLDPDSDMDIVQQHQFYASDTLVRWHGPNERHGEYGQFVPYFALSGETRDCYVTIVPLKERSFHARVRSRRRNATKATINVYRRLLQLGYAEESTSAPLPAPATKGQIALGVMLAIAIITVMFLGFVLQTQRQEDRKKKWYDEWHPDYAHEVTATPPSEPPPPAR